MDEQIIEQAKALPINGSLTFKMLVAQRDWPAVFELAHNISNMTLNEIDCSSYLTSKDWDYINSEAAKDGFRK
jgi:hypothetical protein